MSDSQLRSPVPVGAGRLPVRRVPLILMYHNVGHVERDPNLLSITPARFAEQMAWLDRRGLKGVGVGQLVVAMRDGEHHGMVGLTFDDGYRDLLAHALPELERRGFGATVFLVSDLLGARNNWDEGASWPLLGPDEVHALVDAGLEVGSHGARHLALAGLAPDEVDHELAGSRAALEALTGTPIRGFAYPYGSMDAAARAAVLRAGYAYGCAVRANRRDVSVAALPRLYVGQYDDARHLDLKRLLYKPYHVMKGRRS